MINDNNEIDQQDLSVEEEPTHLPIDLHCDEREKVNKRVKSKIVRKKINNNNNGSGQSITFSIEDIHIDRFRSIDSEISLDTILSISQQIGFIPTNLINISYRDPSDHHPVILKLYALNDNEIYGLNKPENKEDRQLRLPFPTLFWMSCPVLHDKICLLEQDGWIPILNQRLNESEEYCNIMEEAHRLYAEERWDALTEEDKVFVEAKGWLSCIKEVGIAGMRNYKSVKCLHCHYAHYLSRPSHNNIIGQWVHELLQQQDTQNKP